MKKANVFKLLGIAAIAAVIGIGMAACDLPPGDESETITILAIPGVTPPKTGEEPVLSTSTAQYNASIEWVTAGNSTPLAEGDKFKGNTFYIARIRILPKEGYALDKVREDSFTVAGASEVFYTPGDPVVVAKFPATEMTIAGKWELSQEMSGSTYVTQYTFNTDGTMNEDYIIDGSLSTSKNGTYTAAAGKLTTYLERTPEDYVLTGDELKIDGIMGTDTYQRDGTGEGLFGTWTQSVVMLGEKGYVLKNDGTYIQAYFKDDGGTLVPDPDDQYSTTGKYTHTEDTITFAPAYEYDFSISADGKLTLKAGSVEEVYTRVE